MSEQPGPSSDPRSESEVTDESDSDFDEESSEEESDDEYDQGEMFVYHITEKTATFIAKNVTSEVDLKVRKSVEGEWTCDLRATPDNVILFKSILEGLDAALNAWPFSYLLRLLAVECNNTYLTLLVDHPEKVVIIIELCKLFQNHPSGTLEEVETLLGDEDRLMALELTIRNILEYDDYIEVELPAVVDQVLEFFRQNELWSRPAVFLAEKSVNRLVPFLVGSRTYKPEDDLLGLRLVSKKFQERVELILDNDPMAQGWIRKETFGLIETDDICFEIIRNTQSNSFIHHCDITTLKKLLPTLTLPHDGEFSFAFHSKSAHELLDSVRERSEFKFTEPSECIIAGKAYKLVQGTLERTLLQEFVDRIRNFVDDEGANNNLKRKSTDSNHDPPSKSQKTE